MKETITVLGDGAFGTAFAMLLADNGYAVKLWCHNADVAHEIITKRTNNHFLPGVVLPELIIPTTDIHDALHNATYIFEAIPTKYLRAILESVCSSYNSDQKWVVLSKGIEQNTTLFARDIVRGIFGHQVKTALIAGPSFALQLAQRQCTAVNIYADDSADVDALVRICTNSYFKLFVVSDVIGMQVSGALKNVIALALGMLDGAGYGDNTQAYILTRGLDEIAAVIQALQGSGGTAYSLAGVGDLVLTACGHASKNRKFGFLVGKGTLARELMSQPDYSCEGVNTVLSCMAIAQKYKLNLPLCKAVYDIVYHDQPVTILLTTDEH